MNLRPLAPLFLALLAGCSQQPPLRGSGDLAEDLRPAVGETEHDRVRHVAAEDLLGFLELELLRLGGLEVQLEPA